MKLRLVVILLSILAVGPAFGQEARTYTVKSGDTLHHIARAHGMSVNGLMRMNGLTGSLIRIGQVLRLTSRVAVLPAEVFSSDVGHPALAAVNPNVRAGVDPPVRADADPPVHADADPLVYADADPPVHADADQSTRADVDYPDVVAVVQRREQTIGPDTTTADSSAATLDDGMSIDIAETTAETRREMARISDELASRIDTTTYTVREGETLYSIARDLRTKVYILYTLNNGIYGVLEPGTSIVIPAAADGDASENMHVYAVGTVSVFPDSESGRTMAGGSAYDPDEYVVAHPELPFESILIVENPETGRATFARVADRGPLDSPHLMVVSPALASEIGAEAGSGVQIRLVE